MRTLLFILILIPTVVFSQEYTEVVDVPEKTDDQLFKSAKEWIAITYNSANDVIQLSDQESKKIVGKGSVVVSDSYLLGGMMKVPITQTFNSHYTIAIYTKSGKYKIDITGIFVTTAIQTSSSNTTNSEIAFSKLLDQKEYYKNASDPEWLVNNVNLEGAKTPKMYSKPTSLLNKSTYNCICKTEEHFQQILKSLQVAMKKAEASW